MEKESIYVEEAKKWLEQLGRRRFSEDIQYISLQGIQIVQAEKGSILFNHSLHKQLSDKAGNCHVGAIAAIIDAVGATAIAIYTGHLKVSVDFSISYFSTIKIEEEVEIEAKVAAHRGKLSLTTVEFRRKKDGMVVALGKQWMSQIPSIPGVQVHRTKL